MILWPAFLVRASLGQLGLLAGLLLVVPRAFARPIARKPETSRSL